MMSVEKQHRIKDVKNEIARKQTVAGEMLARKMLSDYHHISQENLVFKTGMYGKPYVEGCAEFNISHSEDMVACCIGDKQIGIDVEQLKPITPNIMRKLCTDADVKYILGNVQFEYYTDFSQEQLYRFYEAWTAKEAYFKCIGTGIKNLKRVSFEKLIQYRKTYNVGEYLITIIEK